MTVQRIVIWSEANCFPDAVQRDSGAPQIRDRRSLCVCKGPGSAAHHFMLRCAQDTSTWIASNQLRPSS